MWKLYTEIFDNSHTCAAWFPVNFRKVKKLYIFYFNIYTLKFTISVQKFTVKIMSPAENHDYVVSQTCKASITWLLQKVRQKQGEWHDCVAMIKFLLFSKMCLIELLANNARSLDHSNKALTFWSWIIGGWDTWYNLSLNFGSYTVFALVTLWSFNPWCQIWFSTFVWASIKDGRHHSYKQVHACNLYRLFLYLLC